PSPRVGPWQERTGRRDTATGHDRSDRTTGAERRGAGAMDTTGDGQRPTATSGSDGRGHLWTEDTLVTRLVLAPGALRLPLRALFSYRTDDPYAVHIVWHLDRTTPVWWALDRELL